MTIKHYKKTEERMYPDRVPEMFKCYHCGIVKHYTQFYPTQNKLNGLSSECMLCKQKRGNAYREKNKEKIRYNKRQPLAIYQSYKRRSKAKNLFFDLTVKYFKKYYKTNCFYCNDILPTVGFDRVDNNKGYTIDNTVPCCKMCNVMKNYRNREEFYSHIKKVYEHARMG